MPIDPTKRSTTRTPDLERTQGAAPTPPQTRRGSPAQEPHRDQFVSDENTGRSLTPTAPPAAAAKAKVDSAPAQRGLSVSERQERLEAIQRTKERMAAEADLKAGLRILEEIDDAANATAAAAAKTTRNPKK